MKRAPSSRDGFTLVELIVATTILGIVAAGLASMMLRGAVLSRQAAALGYRTAALDGEVSRLTAFAPGTLTDGTTTKTQSSPPFPYTMTTVVATSGATQTITITLTPTGSGAITAISRSLVRYSTAASPFGP